MLAEVHKLSCPTFCLAQQASLETYVIRMTESRNKLEELHVDIITRNIATEEANEL